MRFGPKAARQPLTRPRHHLGGDNVRGAKKGRPTGRRPGSSSSEGALRDESHEGLRSPHRHSPETSARAGRPSSRRRRRSRALAPLAATRVWVPRCQLETPSAGAGAMSACTVMLALLTYKLVWLWYLRTQGDHPHWNNDRGTNESMCPHSSMPSRLYGDSVGRPNFGGNRGRPHFLKNYLRNYPHFIRGRISRGGLKEKTANSTEWIGVIKDLRRRVLYCPRVKVFVF
jgi:hypothetical protein